MSENNEPMVREDGTYPTEPLRRDMIVATVVQTRVNGVDGANPAPGIRRNLDYFKESIDIAQVGLPSDLLLFHEFPITGFTEWTREQHYNLALEVPLRWSDFVRELELKRPFELPGGPAPGSAWVEMQPIARPGPSPRPHGA